MKLKMVDVTHTNLHTLVYFICRNDHNFKHRTIPYIRYDGRKFASFFLEHKFLRLEFDFSED